MMTEATPGPWHWVTNDWWGGYSGIVGPNNEEVLFPQTSNDGDTGAAWFEEISDEDRNILAAAPDLLAALKEARAELEEVAVELTGEDYNNPRINDAINRAEGKP